ncbi:hypothetical protein ACFWVC_09640 [Streptomyces sp. NPDC058691]|uniref:hypothetical protein n=1 Tax=Streptomyces sp. NPDC058691 TaxID=3346601 RepID=UPI00365257FE
MRAIVAAVSGAVVLSALALPAAAQADARTGGRTVTGFTGFTGFTAKSVGALDAGGIDTISRGVVNGGKDIVLGTTTKKTVGITYTVTSPSGFTTSWAALWQGTDSSTAGAITGALGAPTDSTCVATAADPTVHTCKATLPIDTYVDMFHNGAAGTWKLLVLTYDATGEVQSFNDTVGTIKIKRAAKLTANAAPEPVKKGATITVTGSLTRADWNSAKYAGYGSQKVALQFRKAGTTNYVNVKGITATSKGALKTTVKAAQDGYYRFTYAGSATTGPVSATGDYVDVK